MRTSSRVTFGSLRLHRGPHHCWKTLAELERMAAKGECRRLRLPRQRNPVYELCFVPEPSNTQWDSSQQSITEKEMLANVGCADSKKRIFLARMKIREFGKASPRHKFAAA